MSFSKPDDTMESADNEDINRGPSKWTRAISIQTTQSELVGVHHLQTDIDFDAQLMKVDALDYRPAG